MKHTQNLPGVIPWWTINGRFDPQEANRQLDDLRDKGVTEFFIYPNFGLEEPDFLTEAWFDFIRFVLDACKQKGMHCWIYDELSWPSGTAGGRLCREHPEYRMRTLRHSIITLEAGESWRPEVGEDYYRLEIIGGQLLEVASTVKTGFRNNSDKSVQLSVIRKVLIDDQFLCSMGTSGTQNDAGIMDALNPAAVHTWMEYTYIPFAQRFPKELGKTLRGFFFDEPTMVSPFHTGDIPWTPGLEALFERTYHYDMLPHLRAVFQQIPGEEQFRLDFWNLLANRFAESFAGQLSEWCDQYGLLLSGHCWPEEPSCQRLMTTATGDIHLLQQHLHVPGTDVLFAENCFAEKAGMCPKTPRWARNLIYSAKHPSSSARYNGSHFTICETSGIVFLGTAPSAPAVQRISLDFLAAMGIAIMNPAVQYDKTDFRRHVCGLDAAQPYWKYYRGFVRYWNQLSRFNSRGRTKTKIAVLDPVTMKFAMTDITPDTSIRQETSPLAEHASGAEAMLASLEALVCTQHDFELLFEEVIRQGSISEKGELLVPESAFQAIILPQCYILDTRVYEKLADFQRRGGTLIAVGDAPAFSMTPGGDGRQPITLPVIQLDPADPEFAHNLQKTLDTAAAPCYTLHGEQIDGILAQLRSDTSGWQALLLVNATKGEKKLTVTGSAADCFVSLTDLQADRAYRWNCNDEIILPDGAAFLLSTEPTSANAPCCTDSRKEMIRLPVDGWQFAAPMRNTMLMKLELLHEGTFKPLSDNGDGDIIKDPEETPEMTLRGSFYIENGIPQDLRVWLECTDFRDFMLNGRHVRESCRETVIDPQNIVVPISPYCQLGENVFTVTVKLSHWMLKRYGIRAYYSRLLQSFDPPVLLGNFLVSGLHTIQPVSGTVSCGNLSEKGFSHFAGELSVCRDFQWDGVTPIREIHVGSTMLPVALELNGVWLGSRLWQHGDFAIPKNTLRVGTNTLTIHLSGELWNLLERRGVASVADPLDFIFPEISLMD